MILNLDQNLKIPELYNNAIKNKLLSKNVIKIEPAYIKRPRISIFEVTDDYSKKVLYYIKLSFDVPMNQILTSFKNNFDRRITLHTEYSNQKKELELLVLSAGIYYRFKIY